MFDRIKRRWREARSEGASTQTSSAKTVTDTATATSAAALMEAQELVNKYGAILEHKKTVTASEAVLPAPKQRIKDALVALARHTYSSGATREAVEPLRVGYAHLADFVSESDAKAAIAFEGLAMTDVGELDDAGLGELARRMASSGASALEVTEEIAKEFERLTTEFDERVHKQSGALPTKRS